MYLNPWFSSQTLPQLLFLNRRSHRVTSCDWDRQNLKIRCMVLNICYCHCHRQDFYFCVSAVQIVGEWNQYDKNLWSANPICWNNVLYFVEEADDEFPLVNPEHTTLTRDVVLVVTQTGEGLLKEYWKRQEITIIIKWRQFVSTPSSSFSNSRTGTCWSEFVY